MGIGMSLLEDANRAEQVRIFKRISSVIVPSKVYKRKRKIEIKDSKKEQK